MTASHTPATRASLGWLAWLACAPVAAAAAWQAVQVANSGLPLARLVGEWLWSVNAVVFAVVAALIVTRQPRNTIGWLLFVFPLLAALSAPLDNYYRPLLAQAQSLAGGLWWYTWFQTWSWWLLIGPVFLIAQLFPTGRPVSPRWRWVAVAVLFWFLFFVLVQVTFNPTFEFEDRPPLVNPAGLTWLDLGALLNGPYVVGVVLLAVLSVAAIFVRFRRAGPIERQQIKWLVSVLAVFLAVYVVGAFSAFDSPGPTWFDILLPANILLIPLAIAVAILRYRLWDIDLLIRRTLVYSALTALLALAYFGSVLILQNVFQALTGEGRSALVTVLSTLIIAALFVPVRSRVQRAIDRRFYRQKYDAARTLAAFGAQARDVVELEQLSNQLVEAVDATMQPAHVGLWVKGSPTSRPVAPDHLHAAH